VACATAFCEKRYEYVDVYVFVSKKCDKFIDDARKKKTGGRKSFIAVYAIDSCYNTYSFEKNGVS